MVLELHRKKRSAFWLAVGGTTAVLLDHWFFQPSGGTCGSWLRLCTARELILRATSVNRALCFLRRAIAHHRLQAYPAPAAESYCTEQYLRVAPSLSVELHRSRSVLRSYDRRTRRRVLRDIQGFVTAVQQEVTRAHKADRWSLDGVVLHTEVRDLRHTCVECDTGTCGSMSALSRKMQVRHTRSWKKAVLLKEQEWI